MEKNRKSQQKNRSYKKMNQIDIIELKNKITEI